jgi:VWFA-related protein
MHTTVGCLSLLVGCLALQAQSPPQAGGPRFVAAADAVGIDVLVTDSHGPVRGLTSSDFQLSDSGVRQSVTVVNATDVPLIVSLVVDTSESVAGPILPRLTAGARALLGKLTPQDRVTILTTADVVASSAAAGAASAAAVDGLQQLTAAGGTRLFDAVWAALELISVPAASTPHRAMLVVFSDGRDTTSWFDADAPRAQLDRSQAVVFAVSVPPPPLDPASGSDWSRAARLPDLKFLQSLTDASGGRLFLARDQNELSGALDGALADMRSRYVLYYQPSGVKREGLHTVDVSVNRRHVQVRARRGYAVP